MTMSIAGRIGVAAGLAAVSAALALAAADAGSTERRPVAAHMTTTGTPAHGHILRPDRAGAARVPVTGGTAGQRRLVRDVIARLGAPPLIRRVAVAGTTVTVRVATGRFADPYWPAEVMAREVMFRSARDGAGIALVRLAYTGFTSDVGPGFTPGAARPPATVLAEARRRAAAAGVRIRRLVVFPISTGALELTAEMTARQILEDSRARTAGTVTPGGNGVAWTLRLLAPNGVEVFRGGHAFNYGFAAPSRLDGAASPPLPADLTGPTRLTVTFRWVTPGGGSPAPSTATLDCDGASAGVADPAAACAGLTADWLRYLPPLEGVCSGLFTSSVQIAGTFRGVPVERSSNGCSGVSVERWAGLLGVTRPG